MSDFDRYPSWILLLAAIALAGAVALRYMILDRGSNRRRLWLMLLALWLVGVGLAATGAVRTRTGENITPNEGLLILADLMAGLLVISVPAGRALRRLTDSQLRQLRVRNAMLVALGKGQAIVVVALMLATLAALLVGETALAAKVPGPPAVAACQDYRTTGPGSWLPGMEPCRQMPIKPRSPGRPALRRPDGYDSALRPFRLTCSRRSLTAAPRRASWTIRQSCLTRAT
ncbi:MAG TPA: hypothetical protein VMA72_15635 [Streptosporangiaceae bacterium]|nr:hypothetical protein [Streptosporangiaceae bacterium]